jgi:hypothetical protein
MEPTLGDVSIENTHSSAETAGASADGSPNAASQDTDTSNPVGRRVTFGLEGNSDRKPRRHAALVVKQGPCGFDGSVGVRADREVSHRLIVAVLLLDGQGTNRTADSRGCSRGPSWTARQIPKATSGG